MGHAIPMLVDRDLTQGSLPVAKAGSCQALWSANDKAKARAESPLSGSVCFRAISQCPLLADIVEKVGIAAALKS